MSLVSFVLGLNPYCFRPWLPNPTWSLLHTSCLCQFTDTCLLTGPYDLGISAWRVLILYTNHYQSAYAYGYTLGIALEISIFVLTLTLLLFCWPQAAPSIWPLALSSWTTNPHTLRHTNCFETIYVYFNLNKAFNKGHWPVILGVVYGR